MTLTYLPTEHMYRFFCLTQIFLVAKMFLKEYVFIEVHYLPRSPRLTVNVNRQNDLRKKRKETDINQSPNFHW